MDLEQASGVAILDVNHVHELESDTRSFINAVYAWERERAVTKSGSDQNHDREDIFSNFEIESLGLLRKLKRISYL